MVGFLVGLPSPLYLALPNGKATLPPVGPSAKAPLRSESSQKVARQCLFRALHPQQKNYCKNVTGLLRTEGQKGSADRACLKFAAKRL
jgi:hypothetical protein